jgi:hypothetical protein
MEDRDEKAHSVCPDACLTTFPGWAVDKVRLSVATGGTGGVYYPLGGALARVISKYVPNVEATAEMTSASSLPGTKYLNKLSRRDRYAPLILP